MNDYGRFMAKIQAADNGCWLWRGGTRAGYGVFWLDGELVKAHRYSYEHSYEPIPEGYEVDHLCRTPLCVNPLHLDAVTHRENILRGDTIMAAKAKQTHCIHGHLFDMLNTIMKSNRTRRCRACHNERNRWPNRIYKKALKKEAGIDDTD